MFDVLIEPDKVVSLEELSRAVYGRLQAHAQVAWQGYAFSFEKDRRALNASVKSTLKNLSNNSFNEYADAMSKMK
jgi:hypothetical protein